MAAEDSIKRLEDRLTRLEAALGQLSGGFPPPGGTVVDPAPWGGKVVDPAPWPGYCPPWAWPSWRFHQWPTHVVDPGPFPNPIVDPAAWGAGGFVRPTAGTTLGRIGQIGDPAPIDVSRFTISQLESSLHTINAEKARLNSMETMIKQQLETLKQQQKG